MGKFLEPLNVGSVAPFVPFHLYRFSNFLCVMCRSIKMRYTHIARAIFQVSVAQWEYVDEDGWLFACGAVFESD